MNKLDADLELHHRTWEIDGDLYRCRYCHRGCLASKAAEKFIHASGCDVAGTTCDYPWLVLAQMASTIAKHHGEPSFYWVSGDEGSWNSPEEWAKDYYNNSGEHPESVTLSCAVELPDRAYDSIEFDASGNCVSMRLVSDTPAEQPAPIKAKCDGNHGGPRCADPECWNDVPYFSGGSGNKARRRAEALGLTIPGAPAEKCDTCHDQGEVWTGEIAHQGEWQPPEPVMERCPECGYGDEPLPTPQAVDHAANPDPFAELPDWRTGCAKSFGGTHNNKGPKDSIGNLTCTCGFNWELPF